MGIIGVGTVVRLRFDGRIALVTKITNAGSALGVFYSVIVDGESMDIIDADIAEVISTKGD
jgi:hypothetical protein